MVGQLSADPEWVQLGWVGQSSTPRISYRPAGGPRYILMMMAEGKSAQMPWNRCFSRLCIIPVKYPWASISHKAKCAGWWGTCLASTGFCFLWMAPRPLFCRTLISALWAVSVFVFQTQPLLKRDGMMYPLNDFLSLLLGHRKLGTHKSFHFEQSQFL